MIEQFKMPNGYYDEGAILRAAGMSERAARFDDIFGDAQGAPNIAPEWQAILDEARRRNRAMAESAAQARAIAIAAALKANDWQTLVRLGAARAHRSDDGIVYELTSDGLAVAQGPYQKTSADYADQADREG